MIRTTTASLLTAVVLFAGCGRLPHPLRQKRDQLLLSDPRSQQADLPGRVRYATPLRAGETTPSAGQSTPQTPPSTASADQPSSPSSPAAPVFSDPRFNREATISLQQALALGLKQSDVVRVVSGGGVEAADVTAWDVRSARDRVTAALAEFDTKFAGRFYSTRIRQPPNAFFGPGLAEPTLRDEGGLTADFFKRLISGGEARIAYKPDPGYLFIRGGNGSGFNPSHVGELEFKLRQPIWRGAGLAVNQAPIQVAQLQSRQSAWEFKKAVLESVRSVVVTYFDLYAAREALASIERVLPLSEEVVRLQEAAYKTQWVIYADVAKAKGQLFRFRQDRLELQSRVAEGELRLRNLLGLPPSDGFQLIPATPPERRYLARDANEVVQLALRKQPDLVRQRLNVRIRELQLRVAENALLPRLDFEGLYRMNGLGEDVGDALQQLGTGRYSDWQLGAIMEVPLGRRDASAKTRIAQQQLIKERRLLDQQLLTVSHAIGTNLQRIYFNFQQYEEARRQLEAARQWTYGARLRYRSPVPEGESRNWLLQSLNDYLRALQFVNDSAINEAAVLAEYNQQLVRLEENAGTLLDVFGIYLVWDPGREAQSLLGPMQ